MKFAQIFLPAVLLAICKAQPYNMNGDYYNNGQNSIDMGNNIYRHLDDQQKSEQLIGQYRFLIAKSLLRLKDSCKIYDFLMDIDQKMYDNVNNNNKETTPDVLDNNNAETLVAGQYMDNFMDFGKESGDAVSNLFYIEATSLLRKDPLLEPLLREMLHDQCCQEPSSATIGIDFNKNGQSAPTQQNYCGAGDNGGENNLNPAEKRSTPKKVRFHSWGGKRTPDNIKSDVPKVMIRTPFRPWGGKRTSYNLNNKR